MSLIKNAIVYKAILPTDAEILEHHFNNHLFQEVPDHSPSSIGFTNNSVTGELVTTFQRGLSFTVRHDTKVIPASAIRTEVNRLSAKIKEERGYAPGRKEKAELREDVIGKFLPRALIVSKEIDVFYDTEYQYLIVPTASSNVADNVMSLLIRAIESIKTETIHVSNIKHGLTTRLQSYLNEGDQSVFGSLEPSDSVKLKRDKESVTIQMEVLDSAAVSINEAIDSNFTVDQLGFHYHNMRFNLTSNFHFRSIAAETIPAGENDTPHDTWVTNAQSQLFTLSSIITVLCDLLGYQAPDLTDEPDQGEE